MENIPPLECNFGHHKPLGMDIKAEENFRRCVFKAPQCRLVRYPSLWQCYIVPQGFPHKLENLKATLSLPGNSDDYYSFARDRDG